MSLDQYILIGLVCVLIVYLIDLLISWVKITQLRKRGLAVCIIPPVWYIVLKLLLPRNQDFNRHVNLFEKVDGINIIFNKERIVAVSFARQYIIHIYKPEHVEAILSSSTILDKSWMYTMLQPWLGTGLLTSTNTKWKSRRRLLTPAFHFKILERFLPIFNTQSFILIKKLAAKNGEYVNVVPLLSLCTLDIIGETAMGVEIKSQFNEDSEYVKAIQKMEIIITTRAMFPWMWVDALFYLTPTGREFKEKLNVLHSFTKQVISEKKQELQERKHARKEKIEVHKENMYMQTKERRAFLDLLLHQQLFDNSITEEDIREEVDTFMFEGHDTTAMGLSWALYNLGLYQDIQEKAYQELRGIFGDDRERDVTTDDLREMKYIECVLKESLRLYPSVPLIARSLTKDIEINNVPLPKNSVIHICIHSLHHDPEYYQNPELFDPERFLPENSAGRHPFAYIPFSAGPRNCIGQKFAMLEEKTVIANILRHFRIESLDPPDKVVYCGELVLRPVDEIRVKFIQRPF